MKAKDIDSSIIIYAVGCLFKNGDMTSIILLMILNYIGFMYDLVDYVSNLKDHFIKSKFKSKGLLEVLNNDNLEKFGTKKILNNYSINIKKLSYCYKNTNNNILENVNLSIEENTCNLFIGHSNCN